MKALSLRQPWGWAITHGGKRLENRVWRFLKNGVVDGKICGIAVGELIALHASATRPEDHDWDGVEAALGRKTTDQEESQVYAGMGNIIGVARLQGVLRTVDAMTIAEGKDLHFPQYVVRPEDYAMFVTARGDVGRDQQIDQIKRWWLGPYAFWLEDVMPLKTLIPAKGALSFWEVGSPQLDKIKSQIGKPVPASQPEQMTMFDMSAPPKKSGLH